MVGGRDWGGVILGVSFLPHFSFFITYYLTSEIINVL
jgi:hypothetical protein